MKSFFKKPFINLVQHPLVEHHLSQIRNEKTPPVLFKQGLTFLTQFIFYEMLNSIDLKLKRSTFQTPIAKTQGKLIEPNLIFASILRSGNPMVEALSALLPDVPIGHIGIYRDKNINSTVEYFFRMPKNLINRPIIVCDPLMATGETIDSTISRLKTYGANNINILNILCSQQSLSRIYERHPEIKIFSLAIEKAIDKNGYLMPGLGDAGERLFLIS